MVFKKMLVRYVFDEPDPLLLDEFSNQNVEAAPGEKVATITYQEFDFTSSPLARRRGPQLMLPHDYCSRYLMSRKKDCLQAKPGRLSFMP
jgi:hypothetical protein